MSRLLIISEDTYRPNILTDQILQPNLMDIQIRQVMGQTIECFLIASQLKNKYYLQLYQDIIFTANVIVFQVKESSVRNQSFRDWLKLIPIGRNPIVLFLLQTNNQDTQTKFTNYIVSYFSKDASSSVILVDDITDRSCILARILSQSKNAVSIGDYYRESKTITQVKSFFKYKLKWKQENSAI